MVRTQANQSRGNKFEPMPRLHAFLSSWLKIVILSAKKKTTLQQYKTILDYTINIYLVQRIFTTILYTITTDLYHNVKTVCEQNSIDMDLNP